MEASGGTGEAPHVLQAGSIGKSLQRRPGEEVKQEPGEDLQQWEAQWLEFLKMVDSPHSCWVVPPLLEEPRPGMMLRPSWLPSSK